MTTADVIEQVLRRRIRRLVGLFIAGLVLSGLTAIPLETEARWLMRVTGAGDLVDSQTNSAPVWAWWLTRVTGALIEINERHPFAAYGTDWLAFGHLVIALAFVGAWRDPVRNVWLFHFGLMACALVLPWAFVSGAAREIPVWWRLVDCSFGVLGAVPLWLALQATRRLEARSLRGAPSAPC